jgi:hypothetical protein
MLYLIVLSLAYMLVWKVSQHVFDGYYCSIIHLFDFLFANKNILCSLGFDLFFFFFMICLGF